MKKLSTPFKIVALLAAIGLTTPFTGCTGGDSNGQQAGDSEHTQPDPNEEFFETTKAEVAERLTSISGWLKPQGADFPAVNGGPPTLSEESSFVVAAEAVDSFIWWLNREGGGMMPLEHVDNVRNHTRFSGMKIENYRVANDGGGFKRTQFGIMQTSKPSLEQLKQMHAGLMGSHAILTRKKLVDEIDVKEIEGSDDMEFTGGPMECQILVLDVESLKPVYSTSFEVEAPDEIHLQTHGGKVLKTARERVMYTFHTEANKQLEARIARLFAK